MPRILWLLKLPWVRLLEVVTCVHIIAGVWKHWGA